jgi:hypothetical protein
MIVAQTILLLAAAYCLFGFIFGVLFVARGIAVVDPAAKGAPWSFRLLVLPGAATLWPLLVSRWVRSHLRAGRS